MREARRPSTPPEAGQGSPRPRGRWLRRALDEAVIGLARLMQSVFFREIEVEGLERLPRPPLVIVSNHTNSVVDAVLLLALRGARPRLLAKSTLWSHPVMHPLLVLAGALPVYRRQDAGVDVANNFTTFARCHEDLAAGTNVALFPEGTSHNETGRLPLKTGAARIAIEAEVGRGPLMTRVVPVGLNYEAKDRFRSRVRICVGHPLDPGAEVTRYRKEPGAAVRALTARIAEGLERVTGDNRWPEPAVTPPEAVAWRKKVRLLLGFPLFVVGMVLNWIPYRLPGFISDRVSRTPDEPATYKLLAGLLAFPLFWTAETVLAVQLAGAWGVLMAVLAPASGYAALRFSETRGRE
jgi:1-acyl-sn-glycerol-3-phosphate acyltransferase